MKRTRFGSQCLWHTGWIKCGRNIIYSSKSWQTIRMVTDILDLWASNDHIISCRTILLFINSGDLRVGVILWVFDYLEVPCFIGKLYFRRSMKSIFPHETYYSHCLSLFFFSLRGQWSPVKVIPTRLYCGKRRCSGQICQLSYIEWQFESSFCWNSKWWYMCAYGNEVNMIAKNGLKLCSSGMDITIPQELFRLIMAIFLTKSTTLPQHLLVGVEADSQGSFVHFRPDGSAPRKEKCLFILREKWSKNANSPTTTCKEGRSMSSLN